MQQAFKQGPPSEILTKSGRTFSSARNGLIYYLYYYGIIQAMYYWTDVITSGKN